MYLRLASDDKVDRPAPHLRKSDCGTLGAKLQIGSPFTPP